MPVRPPELKTQSIIDADIQYLEYGDNGPPVVFLHATGFMPWLWHPIACLFAQNHRVIAPFFCNHRITDHNQGGLDWLQLATDLKHLLDALGLGKAFYVGHSMGGTVILLAHALCRIPALKMVLIEPIILPPEAYHMPLSLDMHPLAAKAIKRRNFWRDRQEAYADLMAKPFFKSWDPEVFDLYIAHGICDKIGDGSHDGSPVGVQLTCPPQNEAALFMGAMCHDPWPLLPKVTCPALVVEGAASENRDWIDLKRIAGFMPQGRYTLMDDVGHLIPMQKPAATGRLIQSFFGDQPIP